MDNFELAVLHGDIKGVGLESVRSSFHTVVDKQPVRQPSAELKVNSPTQSANITKQEIKLLGILFANGLS